MSSLTDDLRITEIQEVIPPVELLEDLPLYEEDAQVIVRARKAIHDILKGEDDRVVVIVGPCSIHDPQAARDYAIQLKQLADELKDDVLIVMRVYFEKPRTTVGWKGLINDPDLDESFKINKGLHLARHLLLDLAKLGVPAATEYLDPISPQYISDLISWGAIGARTTESQVHRELASGLSCPVGFKNGTDGSLTVAIDAMRAAASPHVFLSLTKAGHSAIFNTAGNSDTHIILRGGNGEPNYDAQHVAQAAAELEKAGLAPRLMVDCSHANSRKSHENQADVCDDVIGQIAAGSWTIMGLMMESHLVAGRQDIVPGKPLTYGQSITDACMAWDVTVDLLRKLAKAVQTRRDTMK